MRSRIEPRDARVSAGRVRALLTERPDLVGRYEQAKRVVRAFRKPAFYEITQRCNLRCEGCYYFEGGITEPVPEKSAVSAWEDFFAAEARRHVTMAYFVGAEPALEQERLLAAVPWFPWGNIGTNGTIRIDSAVPYRIGVSVWGGDDPTDRKLRGASVFRKALRNYAGDPRAIVLFTLSPWNLDGVRTVAEMCRDHGLPLTFNMYSPTATFLDKLRHWRGNDDRFFRISRPGHTPCFSTEDLLRVRQVIDDLMDELPDTVVYSKPYNAWMTEPGPRYTLDPRTGVATDCGSRVIGHMSYYGPDLRPAAAKCGTSDVDCSQCRMYSGGWSSKFHPSGRDLASAQAFSDWLDMMNVLGTIFLYDREQHRPAATSARAWSGTAPIVNQAWSRARPEFDAVLSNGGASSRAQAGS